MALTIINLHLSINDIVLKINSNCQPNQGVRLSYSNSLANSLRLHFRIKNYSVTITFIFCCFPTAVKNICKAGAIDLQWRTFWFYSTTNVHIIISLNTHHLHLQRMNLRLKGLQWNETLLFFFTRSRCRANIITFYFWHFTPFGTRVVIPFETWMFYVVFKNFSFLSIGHMTWHVTHTHVTHLRMLQFITIRPIPY